jgi:hypothetical protein
VIYYPLSTLMLAASGRSCHLDAGDTPRFESLLGTRLFGITLSYQCSLADGLARRF